jgi:hypothetical protein
MAMICLKKTRAGRAGMLASRPRGDRGGRRDYTRPLVKENPIVPSEVSPGAASAPGRRGLAAAAALLALILAGCGKTEQPPPPPAAALSAEQQTVLQALNRLGEEQVSGRSHRYDFRPPCTLVVHEQLDGKPKPEAQVPIKGIELRVIEYVAGRGFGLKGAVAGRPGSVDLFESAAEANAKEAGDLVGRLAAGCG